MDRLPAFPLIVNDPYFSYWLPGDIPTDCDTTHWSGPVKPMRGTITIDGTPYRYLGLGQEQALVTKNVLVTPTKTTFVLEGGGIELILSFVTPMLPDDLDVLSSPVTFVSFSAVSADGKAHIVKLDFSVPYSFCYDGSDRPEIRKDRILRDGLSIAYAGRKRQNLLCHSGDHITIDWGYMYLASALDTFPCEDGLFFIWETTVESQEKSAFCMVAYDDIASVNYFGTLCKAWYARSDKTIIDVLVDFSARFSELTEKAAALDERIYRDSLEAGGEDYARITAAAWRHCIGAHKLIASPEGEMVLLSKENDSNGCMGTVDVSYPSIPLFLKYCPELVNALARPVLKFAAMPVWKFDFAPHDIGRYPQATGQVYAAFERQQNGDLYPPYYLYGAEADVYSDRFQMPVEECGNMLIMLETAIRFGADDGLAADYIAILDKWVEYLDKYGEDPGEQLCTDDFAGHLAGNVNLSAKAMVGVRAYADLLEHFGRTEEAEKWKMRAEEMAACYLKRIGAEGNTPLTFDGTGWSMKYNLVWDLVLGYGLLPEAFYEKETKSYLPRINRYGLPLDSRADYTKSDWHLWCAAMAKNREVRKALIHPLVTYLEESSSRVAFSDWYDTKTGDNVHFIARSVQGGLFMPMLVL